VRIEVITAVTVKINFVVGSWSIWRRMIWMNDRGLIGTLSWHFPEGAEKKLENPRCPDRGSNSLTTRIRVEGSSYASPFIMKISVIAILLPVV
jgi:hypothetical protein